MKNNGLMTQKEEDLMEFLWKQATPLTITEMAGIGQEEWNQVTLFRIVKGLLNKGYLKIHGFEKIIPSMQGVLYLHLQKKSMLQSFYQNAA